MNILIPAAGKGSRFHNSTYKKPKPCITVDDEYMLVRAAKSLNVDGQYIFIIRENIFRDDLAAKLYENFPSCKIAVVDFDTTGAAETALIAEHLINNDDELIIANCDQIMNWNVDLALKQLRKFDAGLVTIESDDIKHSYALIENNLVAKVVEKEVVSNTALTGIHYWKKGSDFVQSARIMIENNDTSANGEYYIGPSYNYLIKQGKKVGTYMASKNDIYFIGTPEDLQVYENRENK